MRCGTTSSPTGRRFKTWPTVPVGSAGTTLDGAEDLGLNAGGLVDEYAHYGASALHRRGPRFRGDRSRAGSSPRTTAATWPDARRSATSRAAPSSSTSGRSTRPSRGPARTLAPPDVAAQVYADMERHIQAMYPPPALRTPRPGRRRSRGSSPPRRARAARLPTGSIRCRTSTRPTASPTSTRMWSATWRCGASGTRRWSARPRR
jgi:hypothetical protein